MSYTHNDLAKQFWDGTKDGKELEMNKTGYEEALRRALKDFMPRTEKKADGSTEKFGVEEMFECLKKNRFVDKFVKFFNEESKSEDQFNEWHKKQCRFFLTTLENEYTELKPGKAQKIVNMTFKGIYCLNGAEEKEEYFKYCHMPLDSLTLEWFKRKVKDKVKINGKRITKNKVVSWSKLEYDDSESKKEEYTYKEIQDAIREFFNKFKNEMKIDFNTPLKAEFLIWPQIQLELAAEGLYSNLLKCSDELLTNELNKLKREEYEKIENSDTSQKIKRLNTVFRDKTAKDKIKFLKENIGNINYDFICSELIPSEKNN